MATRVLKFEGRFLLNISGEETSNANAFGRLVYIGLLTAKCIFEDAGAGMFKVALYKGVDLVMPYTKLSDIDMDGITPETPTEFANFIAGLPVIHIPPSLNAAADVTVDDLFDITFNDNPTYRAAITDIQVGGVSLDPAAYTILSGVITFDPSKDENLQTAGNHTITVIATGYEDNIVVQNIGVGALASVQITTQPASPITNPGLLGTQPVVRVSDQYDNGISANVIRVAYFAAPNTITGTTSIATVDGNAAWVDMGVVGGINGGSGNYIEFWIPGGVAPAATSDTFAIPGF